MVKSERQGTIVQYSLADNRLVEALDLLRAVLREGLVKRAELVDVIP
jgi:DNA-binding transcriptional ArsR family regulator